MIGTLVCKAETWSRSERELILLDPVWDLQVDLGQDLAATNILQG